MSRQLPRVLGATLGILVCALCVGVSWACIPQARLVTLQPQSFGPPGTKVRVNGLAFDPGPVEVRWNASDGPELGRATGPNFSVEIATPEAAEGLHSVVVLSRASNGAVGNAGAAAFQVTGPAGSDRGAAPPAGGETATSNGVSSARRSSGTSGAVLAMVGGGLVALGVAVGVMLSRRRTTA